MDPFGVDTAACRGRQARLIAEIEPLGVDCVVLTQMESIQWLSGARFGPLFQPAAAMWCDGGVVAVVPQRKVAGLEIAADQVEAYDAQWHSTLRNDQRAASSHVLLDALRARTAPRRIGVEFSSFPPHLSLALQAEAVDIEPLLYRLRRRKDADELAMMRRAIAATEAMYGAAREVIRPGINELDLYGRLHATATDVLGEPPTYFGQDFQSNSRGGPPRDRDACAGELYILDLGAGFRGYFSDNARTFAVDGRPSGVQRAAWDEIDKVFDLVEATVRPGASCRELFARVQSMLDQCRLGQFNHHLGHGVGLFPHEAPHLNPHWDDRFEVGDVFTVEPGLYSDALRHGMRIEENYLVTDGGVERLTQYPRNLA
jgi:Xaa-Pro aminopeptidase